MTAIDYPRIPQIWTPERERRAAARVCPKCGKRIRGFFERQRDRFLNRMPVNGCCCGTTPPPACSSCTGSPPSTILLTVSGITLCSGGTTCHQDGGQAWTWSGTAPNGTFCLTPLCGCVYGAAAPVINLYQWLDGTPPGTCPPCSTPGTILETYNMWFAELDDSFGPLQLHVAYGWLQFSPCGYSTARIFNTNFFPTSVAACNPFTVTKVNNNNGTGGNGSTPCDWSGAPCLNMNNVSPPTPPLGSVMYGGTITATANGC